MTHTVTSTHIDFIRPGDTVLIDGHLKTVCPNDFTLVAEDSERVAEIRNAVLRALGLNVEA